MHTFFLITLDALQLGEFYIPAVTAFMEDEYPSPSPQPEDIFMDYKEKYLNVLWQINPMDVFSNSYDLKN
jgi:hypothetical protein